MPIFLLFIICIDVLIDGRQLFLCGRGNLVSEHGLLKCNEWYIGVVEGGEKVVVLVESGFIAANVKCPSLLQLRLERGAFLAVQA